MESAGLTAGHSTLPGTKTQGDLAPVPCSPLFLLLLFQTHRAEQGQHTNKEEKSIPGCVLPVWMSTLSEVRSEGQRGSNFSDRYVEPDFTKFRLRASGWGM